MTAKRKVRIFTAMSPNGWDSAGWGYGDGDEEPADVEVLVRTGWAAQEEEAGQRVYYQWVTVELPVPGAGPAGGSCGGGGAVKTATLIATQSWLLTRARVYRLSEPVPWKCVMSGERGTTDHVVVSVNPAPFDTGQPEAMAFACDASGEMLGDGHVQVGVARSAEHDDALRAMGFEIIPPAELVPELPPSWSGEDGLAGLSDEEANDKIRALCREMAESYRKMAETARGMTLEFRRTEP